MKSIEFLKTVFAKADTGYGVLSTLNPTSTYAFKLDDTEEFLNAGRWCDTLSKTHNVYFGLGIHGLPPATGSRGNAEAVIGIPAIGFDIDVADTGRYAGSKNPSLTWPEIKAHWLGVGLPELSLVVSSGNGFHGYLLLKEPVETVGDAQRNRVEAVTKGINSAAKILTGWKLDNMGDLARILRPAGTSNFRDPLNPKPVEVVEDNSQHRYDFEELERFVFEHSAKAQVATRSKSSFKPTGGTYALPVFESIVQGCNFIRHAVEDASTLPEPEWYTALTVVAACHDAENIAHLISKSHPKYDPAEVEKKLKHASEFPPRTCAYIREEFENEGCAKCIFNGNSNFKSPVKLGNYEPNEANLIATSVIDYSSLTYINWVTDEIIRDSSFNKKFLHLGISNPANFVANQPIALKVKGLDYVPNGPRLIADGTDKLLNIWRPSQIKPQSGDCADILGHMQYLFPDEAERNHLLDYMSSLTKNPAEKISHAIMIVGTQQGTGKSMLVGWLRDILGEHNVAILSNEMILSRWTSNRANKQLAVVEEIMGDGRLTTYNSLKEWISEEYAMSEEKNMPVVRARTPRGFFFTTNYLDSLMPDSSDRRLFVLGTSAQPNAPIYYSNLAVRAKEQLPAFYQYLLDRDISQFNSKAPPPITRAKLDMVDMSTPPVQSALTDLLSDKEGVFAYDFGPLDEVERELLLKDNRFATLRIGEIKKALRRLGAAPYDVQIQLRGRRQRVWIWRNNVKWQKSPPSALADAYRDTAPRP